MSRPLKKPFYNKQKITRELLDRIAEAFGAPYDDRDCVGEHKPSLREVAEVFDIAPIRMRKLLITAGVYSTKLSREIVAYVESGMSMEEIERRTNLSRASVHSYIPYFKTVYKLPERSTDAERTILYRKRQNMVQDFQGKLSQLELTDCIDCDDNSLSDDIWNLIIVFEGYPFKTYQGLQFRYHVKGNEIFVDRKEHSKSITKSSVDMAVKNAIKLRCQGITEYGPKKLQVFGASYLWAILRRFGL